MTRNKQFVVKNPDGDILATSWVALDPAIFEMQKQALTDAGLEYEITEIVNVADIVNWATEIGG